MELTFLGILTFFACLGAWRLGADRLLGLTLLLTVFGAAAALKLPALGGTSIMPAYFALGATILRMISGPRAPMLKAVQDNLWLGVFAAYSAISAIILPRLFAGTMDVVSMRPNFGMNGVLIEPLRPSTQNVTQGLYIIGTFASAVAAHYFSRLYPGPFVMRAAIAAAGLYCFFGFADLAGAMLGNTHLLDVLRNGAYGQLVQFEHGFKRVSGVFPEPSAYATFGFIMFCLMFELWLRDVWPKTTALLSALVCVALALSTSSTAYISLCCYALICVFRLLFVMPSRRSYQKIAGLAVGIVVVVAGALLFSLSRPDEWQRINDLGYAMTFGKIDSSSGAERSAWMQQGLTALQNSYGMGIGVGSFRSSSLLTAILGATGMFGAAAFVLHLWRVAQPLSSPSYTLDLPFDQACAEAAGSAALFGLIPLIFSAASADPGLPFALLAGFALGRRRQTEMVSRTIAPLFSKQTREA